MTFAAMLHQTVSSPMHRQQPPAPEPEQEADDYRDHAADRIAEMVAAGWDQREASLALFGGAL